MQTRCTVQPPVASMINEPHKISPESPRRHRSLKRSRINQIAHHTEHNFQHHSHQIAAVRIWIRSENHQRIKSNQWKPEAVRQHRPWKKRNLIIHRTFHIMNPALKNLASEIQQYLKRKQDSLHPYQFLKHIIASLGLARLFLKSYKIL